MCTGIHCDLTCQVVIILGLEAAQGEGGQAQSIALAVA